MLLATFTRPKRKKRRAVAPSWRAKDCFLFYFNCCFREHASGKYESAFMNINGSDERCVVVWSSKQAMLLFSRINYDLSIQF